ncbi:MAG: sporulation integral membrane protein YtvI [Oscillospiraceae bacterium]|nr:sporulation integral membrane protein YtvI [Oscillospiraceae bacterium]
MYQRQKIFLLRLATAAAVTILVWLGVRYVLAWVLPFLIALGLAALAEPAIDFCRRRMHFKRSFTAAVLTLALLVGLTAAVAVILTALLRQAYDLLTALPAQLEQLPSLLEQLRRRFDAFCAACPASLRRALENLTAQLSPQLSILLQRFTSTCITFVTDALSKLPQALLFCGTTALAVFFAASNYPSIMAFLRRQLPPQSLRTAQGVKSSLYTTLGKWLRWELTLIAITFIQLLVGLVLLGEPYALLLAFLIALIDALPVFGTGTVLLPWSLITLIAGNVPRGIALLALYGCISLVRAILEPRVMAAQAGLPPLLTLLAMYVGFSTCGVGGMLLFPIGLLFIKQLHDAGYLHLWK